MNFAGPWSHSVLLFIWRSPQVLGFSLTNPGTCLGLAIQALPPHLPDPSTNWSQEYLQFSSVQSLSHVRLFATPWTVACQASLSITNSQSPPKPMSIESVMPSNHLILCHTLLLLPSIFPSIRVFSNESALHIRWPKYWSFSFNISPSNEHPGLISFRMDWLHLLAVQGTLKSLHSSKVLLGNFKSGPLLCVFSPQIIYVPLEMRKEEKKWTPLFPSLYK